MILGVDVGGTFTDAVLVTPHRVFSAKTLSTDPQSEGVLAAARAVLGRARVAPAEVDRFVHGMTVATNALLERRGARTVLLTTEGFRDLLTIGRQERLHLYTLFPERTPPLVAREDCVTVGERAGPAGVEKPLLAAEVERVVRLVAACAPEAVAVCLLWSFRHPEHEQRLAAALRAALPEVPVVCSAEVAPLFREFERMSTAVLDAYVTPRTGRYLERLTEGCLAAGLPMPEIMTSSGGTSPYEQARRHGARLLLSGPAGGVRAGAALARGLGYERVLTFDMGGTSTDCAAVDLRGSHAGEVPLPTSTERQVAGFPCRLPMVDIHTVSAGGGSVATVDAGGALKVGPQSAGADPGPACYGRGGVAATVTDANLVLGRIRPDRPLARTVELVPEAARQALGRLAARAGLGVEEAAEGVLRVGVFNMAAALRKVTLERGLDPRGYVLLAFGGAGGLHACELADEIGAPEVLLPLRAGAFSAEGLAAAPSRFDRTASLLWDLGTLSEEEWRRQWAALEEAVAADRDSAARGPAQPGSDAAAGRSAEPGSGQEVDGVFPVDRAAVDYRWEVEARYSGQAYELGLVVERGSAIGPLAERFHRLHEERFGYAEPAGRVEVIAARVVAEVRAPLAAQERAVPRLRLAGEGALYADQAWRQIPYYEVVIEEEGEADGGFASDGGVVTEAEDEGEDGTAGAEAALFGPLVVSAEQYSAYVPRGWQVTSVAGALRLRRLGPAEEPGVVL